MGETELGQLYDRLNKLPDLYQTSILAEIYGTLRFHVREGDETALELIKGIKESVERWEARINGDSRSLSS